MRVPDFEKLIQETEDYYSPEDENIRNLIGIVLFLCNYNEGSIESTHVYDLCINNEVYSKLVQEYAVKYGIPPLINVLKDGVGMWVCNYDTRSMRDIASSLIGKVMKRPSNDFLRIQ